MAKKRKKNKEEQQEYEFTPPEFDEREFLEKELRDTKTVIVTVGYGGLFGAIAGMLCLVDESLALIGLPLVLGGLYSLKYFYRIVKIDTTQFQKKNWAGNVVWFFFTFLAVWVLMFNYPVSDHANPSVTNVIVWVDNGTNVTAIDYKYVDSAGSNMWVPRWDEILSTMIHANSSYTVNITAKVADNGVLESALISVNGGDFVPMVSEGNHRYGFSVTGDQLSSGSLTFTIRATDEVGHEQIFTPVNAIPVAA